MVVERPRLSCNLRLHDDMLMSMTTTRNTSPRSRARLQGDTTTKMLVHSLAISLVNDDDVFDVTLTHGPQAGKIVQRAHISLYDLQAVVGGALAASTLKSVLRNHPGLSVSADQGLDAKVSVTL
jgi:hypothetical protein